MFLFEFSIEWPAGENRMSFPSGGTVAFYHTQWNFTQNCDAFGCPVTAVALLLFLLLKMMMIMTLFVAPCPSRCRVIPGMSAVQGDSSERHGGESLLLLGRWSDRGTLLCEKWQRERPWTRHRRVRVAFARCDSVMVRGCGGRGWVTISFMALCQMKTKHFKLFKKNLFLCFTVCLFLSGYLKPCTATRLFTFTTSHIHRRQI